MTEQTLTGIFESREALMNHYYNEGGFNRPWRIGYVMNMIRDLKPLTEDEWFLYYLNNVHDWDYLRALAVEMKKTIPAEEGITCKECLQYICDVMFRRTFLGYNKEKSALKILQAEISPDVKEAPAEWDTKYFIDFYVKSKKGKLIGIQLKPETFYAGHYENTINIDERMESFRRDMDADAYILQYKVGQPGKVQFVNPEVIERIKLTIRKDEMNANRPRHPMFESLSCVSILSRGQRFA